MWDLIVSVPDHCLSFYFPLLVRHFTDEAIEKMIILRMTVIAISISV